MFDLLIGKEGRYIIMQAELILRSTRLDNRSQNEPKVHSRSASRVRLGILFFAQYFSTTIVVMIT